MAPIADPFYERRRIDQLTDQRLSSIEQRQSDNGKKLDALDDKVDKLSARLSYLFGAIAVLSVLVNFLAPIILNAITSGKVP